MGLCLYIVVKVFLFHTMLFPTLMNDVLLNFSSPRSSIYQFSSIEFHPSSSQTQNAEATKQNKNLIIHPVQPFVKLFLFSDCQTIFSNHSKERKKEWQLQELDPVYSALDYWATLDPTFCICFLFDRHWINSEAKEILFKYCSLARNKPLCILILLWNDPTPSSNRK